MYGGVERIAAVLQELVCRAQVVQEGGAVSLVERWWELIAGDVAGAAVDDKGGFKEVWALCISHCFFFRCFSLMPLMIIWRCSAIYMEAGPRLHCRRLYLIWDK